MDLSSVANALGGIMIQSAPIHPASSAVSECFQPDQYLPFFKEWFNRLQASLEKSLPRFDPDFDVLLPAVRTLASITQQNTEEEKRQQLEQIAIVEKVLDAYPLRNIFNDQDPPGEDHTVNGSIEAELIARTVLAQASPERLSEWCKLNHPINKSSAISVVQQLLDFLHNVPLMRLFLESGGARNGQYGPAIQIYHQLLNGDEQQQNPWNKDDLVLNRLALAVALELADPYHLFNTETTGHSTNASLRFKHYALAYQSGDLDPAFAQFTVWELRHAINSDATEEELAVGRASLLAYRPDIALLNREAFDDAKWRYAFVVKTDVAYTTPDWYKPSRSYDQILSGGGKCGPRAWYGRFVCKAFGIPTWGCRQPGHAAMMRWTRKGWDVCLGGSIDKSWWDNDRGGTDFLLETQARNACASDAVYGQKVLRLQWIASVWQENESTVRRHCQPDPKSPWYTLAMYQRRRLAPLATNELEHPHPVNIGDGDGTGVQHNKIGALLQQQSSPSSTVCEAVCRSDETGVILIPAAAWSSPTSTGNKVQFMASFLGGQQLFVKEDCVLEYILPKHFLPTGSARYLFTCRIATAHRSEKPISLTIGGDCGVSYEVALPYTMGMWGETEPVVVELDGSKQNSVVPLRLARSHQPFGFALKDLRLVPVLK